MWDMQTQYDSFEREFSQKMEEVQTLDLVGVHVEFSTLRAAIKDMVVRTISNYPIIKENQLIRKEERDRERKER